MRQLLNIAYASMVDSVGSAETERILSGESAADSSGEKQRAAMAMLDYVGGLEIT